VENLEPSRWLPVYQYICDPGLNFDFLRNKVEGLKNTDIDKLMDMDREELRRFMRGELPQSDGMQKYKSLLGEGCYQRIVEFTQAAGFLRRTLGTDGGSAEAPPAFKQLNFGAQGLNLSYPFASNSCTKLVASLLLSYLYNPHYAVAEFFRILKPGGTAIISSMKPDSDVSMIFTRYTESLRRTGGDSSNNPFPQKLTGAMDMLNEAAGLFELEQEGYFKFFTAEELIAICENSGFQSIQVYRSLGSPPQALIVVARKPLQGDE
jgi:SAM-dependent methyltransferase